MALPAPGYLSDPERTNAEMKQALEDQRDVIDAIDKRLDLSDDGANYRLRLLRGCLALEEID